MHSTYKHTWDLPGTTIVLHCPPLSMFTAAVGWYLHCSKSLLWYFFMEQKTQVYGPLGVWFVCFIMYIMLLMTVFLLRESLWICQANSVYDHYFIIGWLVKIWFHSTMFHVYIVSHCWNSGHPLMILVSHVAVDCEETTLVPGEQTDSLVVLFVIAKCGSILSCSYQCQIAARPPFSDGIPAGKDLVRQVFLVLGEIKKGNHWWQHAAIMEEHP